MTTFDEKLRRSTGPDSGGLFGVVTAVADRQGRILQSSAGGRVKWTQDSHPPNLDTTYWAYSFTKLLTTIAALQCVERGQIGLDDPVGPILPELDEPRIIHSSDSKAGHDKSFQVVPAKGHITLRHLLTHTSGIGYDAMNPILTKWRESRGEGIMAMCGDVVKAYSMPLLFEPGESWSYGGGLDWAGQLVERLSGCDRLGIYMEKNIFSKLKMPNTTFCVADNPDIDAKLMDMSARTPAGDLVPSPEMYPRNAETDSGGMGIVTSVGDFMKVLVDLISEQPQLLRPETRDRMFEPQFATKSKHSTAMMAMPVSYLLFLSQVLKF
ncbi:uncharacterized protein N0V89_004975 [Didymosphaeria variabile]|uniref:Beta-lactamase-related domain-containing protein n=1 Tax=Didymosphaeria variabile TaxID=1932322 RepID=A0A9W8XLA3_9PLEO|nr:uncharacterized protein N0V89_004975 [Didymosphaeria variabile]KAJ4353248.1 hypothetical protein N0V89_004975 [Didymosphaeria variabile]